MKYGILRKLNRSIKQRGLMITAQRVKERAVREYHERVRVNYNRWQRRNEAMFLASKTEVLEEIGKWPFRPLITVITPTYNSDPTLLASAVKSLVEQPYPDWELVVSDDASTRRETLRVLDEIETIDSRIRVIRNAENVGISANTNAALNGASGELITFLDHDDLLAPCALYEVAKEYLKNQFDVLYSDEDKINEKGKYVNPFFKPDYSPDYLLSCNYFNHLTVYHRSVVSRVGQFRTEFDGAQDYDYLLRTVEVSSKIVHLPKVLYHWRKVPGSTADSFDSKSYAHDAGQRAVLAALTRREEVGSVLDTSVPGHYRVCRALSKSPLVSIIIPTRDKVDVLRRCIDSLEKSTYKNYEVLIIDNGSTEKPTLDYLDNLKGVKIVKYSMPFNYSRLNNLAVKEASGEVLVFLNNDTEVITPDWLQEMLQHVQRPNVGVVGAKLLYPDGRIQHAGVLLGIGGVANHSHRLFPRNASGYFSCLVDIRNYSAVTGACMMVSRRVFSKVGGFDEENLKIAFNDVDLCLKTLENGYTCVFTPYAELYHHESVSRGHVVDENEVTFMQKKWSRLLQNDPYYNPHLTRTRTDFSMELRRVSPGLGLE